MTLPIIEKPIFELTIPSTMEKAKYVPFTVKEEKILLIAQESNDLHQVINAIKQVVKNCFPDTKTEELALFDYEYMLLHLRSKSVNNGLEFTVEDKETEERIKLELDLNSVEVTRKEGHDRVIELDENTHIHMNYPQFNILEKMNEAKPEDREVILFDAMLECIGQIIIGDQVLKLSDYSKEETTRFLESLLGVHVEKIKTFFNTIPKLRIEIPYKNKNGTEVTFVAEGTESFFL